MAAIEDIDYLWENCDKDSALIYLDSEKRDRYVFPYPNKYTIEFQTPFRLVYGYDILDAMLPTTMFNVEPHNNLIVLTTIASTRRFWNAKTIDSFAFVAEFQDTVPELVHRISDATPGSLALAHTDKLEMFGVDHVAEMSDLHKQIVLVSQRAVGTSVAPSEESLQDFDVVVDDNGTIWYVAKPQAGSSLSRNRFTVKPSATDATTAEITFLQPRYLTEAGAAMMVDTQAYDILLTTYNIVLNVQNYENTQLQQNINNSMNTFGMGCSHASPIPEQANRLIFSGQTPFIMNMDASTCQSIIGFNLLSEPRGVAGKYVDVSPVVDPRRKMFMSFYNAKNQRQEIQSPGLLNLGGVRFLVFRCPELEAHAYAGKSFMASNLGLGIFKLVAGANGISNLRFDYTNFVARPFHPIGKLSRLSVRFETADGELYDMKGINHHILMAIKYLVPSVSKHAANSLHRYQIRLLNDEYDPDVMRFQMREREIQHEEQESSPAQEPSVPDEPKYPSLSDNATKLIQGLVRLYRGDPV